MEADPYFQVRSEFANPNELYQEEEDEDVPPEPEIYPSERQQSLSTTERPQYMRDTVS